MEFRRLSKSYNISNYLYYKQDITHHYHQFSHIVPLITHSKASSYIIPVRLYNLSFNCITNIRLFCNCFCISFAKLHITRIGLLVSVRYSTVILSVFRSFSLFTRSRVYEFPGGFLISLIISLIGNFAVSYTIPNISVFQFLQIEIWISASLYLVAVDYPSIELTFSSIDVWNIYLPTILSQAANLNSNI